LGRLRRRWEDNIKKDLKEIGIRLTWVGHVVRIEEVGSVFKISTGRTTGSFGQA
jgi:hypothetical protein